MTPKEKAEDLYNKFDMIIYTDQDHKSQCKRCAIRAVDEILDVIEDDGFTFAEYHDKKTIEFWLEVKQEIEIL